MYNEEINLEELYLQAKKSYYTGESIMSDDEFDRLEEHLRMENSPVLDIVGFDDEDRNAKFNHPSKMLSLAKYQASLDGTPPTSSATAWMKKFNHSSYEATPKFDGNAVNYIYKNGKLQAVLSRGNGTAGRDYTTKLYNTAPSNIQFPSDVEIVEVRGEIVIPTKVFDEKYSQFKNERNFVAGILNRDEDVSEIVSDFVFMAVEIRAHKYNAEMEYLPIQEYFPKWNFNAKFPLLIYIFSSNEFENAYKTLLDYRQNACPFRLDGFVIKTQEKYRPEIGENSHDPNWSVAIKFPPQEAVTTIEKIQWNFGKTGEYTPIAIMEPVQLDGTTVTRATMFNYGYVIKNNCFPGAVVSIAKSGDIIPQIQKVLKKANTPITNHPTHCTKCNHELEITGVHLICSNETCEGKKYYKFIQGFNQLGIDGSGGAMIKKLWSAGFISAVELFEKSKFTKEKLIASGEFKEGKTLNRLYDQVVNIKELSLPKLLLMLGFDGMGRTTSKAITNQVAGLDFDYHGLEKRVVSGFGEGESKRLIVENAIKILSDNGITITKPESINKEDITFECTGSPTAFGYKTKKDFIEYAKTKGYRHTGLKDAKILFTDDITSTSGKMKDAAKRGVTAKLYSEI